MRKHSRVIGVLCVAVLLAGAGCEYLEQFNLQAPAAPVYRMPFGVSLDGQAARVVSPRDTFGRVPGVVPADAVIAVGVRTDQVIINVFPSGSSGKVPQGAKAAVIMFKGSKGALDGTMDKKALDAGTYVMNVVANQQTARILFRVR